MYSSNLNYQSRRLRRRLQRKYVLKLARRSYVNGSTMPFISKPP